MGGVADASTPTRSTTVTGHLVLIDLAGKVRSKLKVHGGVVNGAQSSEVVRDLAVVDDSEKVAVGRLSVLDTTGEFVLQHDVKWRSVYNGERCYTGQGFFYHSVSLIVP